MFSGLDINDDDNLSNNNNNNNNNNNDNNDDNNDNDNDGFTKIERKSRNISNTSIYKPKKTTNFAMVGNKIYNDKTTNNKK
jgi:hypothetical protein